MPRVPLQITTAARAAPKGPKVRLTDLPPGSVHLPGSAGYHGQGYQGGPKAANGRGTHGTDRAFWDQGVKHANDRAARDAKWEHQDRQMGRVAYGIGGGTAVAGIGAGLALNAHGNRRVRQTKAGLRDNKLGIRKNVWEPTMPFVRAARTNAHGVHNVTSMKPKLSREQRFATWASQRDHGDALVYGGGIVGGLGLTAGAQSAADKTKRATRQRRAQLKRQPVAKSRGGAAYMLRNAKTSLHPKNITSTQLFAPQTLAFGGLGAGAGVSAVEGSRKERRPMSRGERAALGAVGGQLAYQGATYGSNAVATARHNKIYLDPATRRGYHDPGTKKVEEDHKKKYRGDPKGHYRNQPLVNREGKKIPGARHLRINAHLTTGKRGFAVGTLATAAGAAHAATNGRGSKQVMAKSLYQREERISPLRAAGLGVAGVLGLYGIGHSRLVGRQLTRGIKLATVDGNQRAAAALMRAQAARGSIRAGMAPGEAALRRYKAINDAIEAVPKSIRGEVALAAGIVLGAKSMPVHRTHYSSVSMPVPSYGRRW